MVEQTIREQIKEQLAVFREIDVAIMESYNELPPEFHKYVSFESYYNFYRGKIRADFAKLKELHEAELLEEEEKTEFENQTEEDDWAVRD